MRLALFQMNSVDRSVLDTVALCDQACAQAKAGGADLIVFPEMALSGYNIGRDRIHQLAEPADGPMVQSLIEMARRHDLAVLCGFPEKHGDKVYNAAALVDCSGEVLSICRKTHLFGDVDRAAFSAAECLCPLVQFKGWSLGLAICYDIEFPELVRTYALQGAEAILVPTANMAPYIGVATRMVPTRAEENEIYMAYANRVGSEGAFDYCGLSCVAGPDGQDIARAGTSQEMIFADLSKTHLSNARSALSHLRDRRADLYR